MTGVVLMAGLLLLPALQVHAFDIIGPCSNTGADCNMVKVSTTKAEDQTRGIITTALGILGGLCVLMIVIGGAKYMLSQGDASKVQSAKNTVLYSVIGLVVAVAAAVIVNFVAVSFK